MLSTIVSATLIGASAVAAAPFKFPLPNGFPDIKVPSPALTAIEKQAHGTLPNSPLAKHLASGDITTFEVIVTNELFEVAFFTDLIKNISSKVPGYDVPAAGDETNVLTALRAIVAQEELHAIGANAILATAGATPIQPCEYVFPCDSLDSAIEFASTFTDVVLGTLQDAQNGFAVNGDPEYIGLVGSIIGQEGEQDGYFRSLLDKIPSQLPFLTRSTGPWAYSVLNQLVLVPGTCPQANIIDVPIFGPLVVDTPKVSPKTQNIEFSFTNNGTDTSTISLVYQNQQNLPIVEKPKNIKQHGDWVTFEATFPYDTYLMNGLTIAVVTDSAGPFASADDVAAVTLFGPAIIEIN